MIARRTASSHRHPASGRHRAPRAWHDPALWAWVAVAVFALLPLTHAIASPAPMPDTDEPDASTIPGMIAMPAMPPVKKLTDGDLTCRDIYIEVQELERTLKAHEAASAAHQRDLQQAATAMMDSGTAISGIGTASGLLGMIPGIGGIVGGMVGSVATQAASAAAVASARERQGQMMSTTQKMVASYQLQAAAAGRRDYLTDLFLQRSCKLAEVKAALAKESAAGVAPAVQKDAPGNGPLAGAAPAAAKDASPDANVTPAVPGAAALRGDQASAEGAATP